MGARVGGGGGGGAPSALLAQPLPPQPSLPPSPARTNTPSPPRARPPGWLAAALTALQDLNLQGCRNLGSAAGALPGLSSLTALTALSLKSCDRLADGCLGFLPALAPSLRALDLTGCRGLTPAGLAPLAAASRLHCLRLAHCAGLRGPSAIGAVSALTSLTSLSLAGEHQQQQQQRARHGVWGRRLPAVARSWVRPLPIPPPPTHSFCTAHPPTHPPTPVQAATG